jgi:hypothetical protein
VLGFDAQMRIIGAIAYVYSSHESAYHNRDGRAAPGSSASSARHARPEGNCGQGTQRGSPNLETPGPGRSSGVRSRPRPR